VSSSNSEGQIIKATKVKLHDKFQTKRDDEYDVAIALLNEEVSFGGMRKNYRLLKKKLIFMTLLTGFYKH
jgi:hypothetical protein